MSHITRVGLIAKRHLDAAAGVLAELAGWLQARNIRAVFETQTARLAGVPPDWPTSSRDDPISTCPVRRGCTLNATDSLVITCALAR